MSRICIVTWYISENYGTCLQSYALHKLLSQENECVFLNRRTYYGSGMKKWYLKKAIIKCIEKKDQLIGKLTNRNQEEAKKCKQKKINRYRVFINKRYSFVDIASEDDINKLNAWADCFIVGGDQMWNPYVYTPAYMLDFVDENKRMVSYGTSLGIEQVPNKYKKELSKYLSRFDSICVREESGARIVGEATGKAAEVHLDPTLLLSKEEWKEFSNTDLSSQISNIPEDYVVCYFLGDNEENWASARNICEVARLKMVVIPMNASDYSRGDYRIDDATAQDFLYLINNAQYVLTDSFHAIVFSLIFETDFYVFNRFKADDKKSQQTRIFNLLNTYGLAERTWTGKMDNPIDYNPVRELIFSKRENSLKYLFAAIKGEL